MLYYFVLTVCIIGSCSSSNNVSREISAILKSYEESEYDKSIRPNYGSGPVNINLSIAILDIYSIDEVKMEYVIDAFVEQTWTDDRLVFNETDEIKNIVVKTDIVKKLWLPDTFVANGRETKTHVTTETNTETNSLVEIKPSGTVFHSTRLTVIAKCFMDLKYFPMDSQTCKLVFESYSYRLKDVELFWNDDFSTDHLKKIELTNFQVSKSRLIKKVNQFQEGSGKFSNLIFEVLLIRSLGYYINQVYIPTILIVIISWIPFWLDRKDTNARVALGVTTVLTMTTLVTQTNAVMPKISYLKALDIYLEFSFAMVFLSLIQYAIVCYFSLKIMKKDQVSSNCSCKHQDQIHDKGKDVHFIVLNPGYPNKIDWHCRWLFPTIFTLFNIIYWITYLSLSAPDFK